jgi:predicted nucleic acid-binding protein
VTTVIDASALVAALVDSGREGAWAESVIAEGVLASPELALAEAGNILRRLEQAGRISRGEATCAYGDLLRLDLELFPFAPFAQRIWVLRHNLTCYDAWYVALAEALDCPLATLDHRLSRAIGPTCEVIVPDHCHDNDK